MNIKQDKTKGFWNDQDGFSITDVLALGFSFLYAIVSVMMFIKLWTGELTDTAIDFFQVFSYPMLVILGGYFGNKLTGKIVGKFKEMRSNKRNKELKSYDNVSSDMPNI